MQNLTPELKLVQYNEISVLELNHTVGQAKIALQGGQLLSWIPKDSEDVFWLSEIEPFINGNAIRGGVPICYPWFGASKNVGEPSHGYARLQLWKLAEYQIESEKVRLVLALNEEAKIEFIFSQQLVIYFHHLTDTPAQVALHSYFKVSDIDKIKVENLPTTVFNSLTKQQESVPASREIHELVDCIYHYEQPSIIVDQARKIQIEHLNASEIVLWNPYHKPTSAMTETGYKTMVCVETARINQLVGKETIGVRITIQA